ncbi:acyltransferase family protein [Proteus mirabilis]|uniref:acyltransferase family protein n=1 Tax=Proteus mirabilis TaxID=584 RepID=UPI002577F1E2|nr:acyltransferase [Proteus mirabilis]MDM3657221.1 acyltransferase [Proteus mirabilis]MDM3668177.1 acyltransferase [Proteus mirabilis]HCQ9179027.1 acyltransferase [Proteus mirabilis]HDA9901417.1 acyltransferase [Proteus mirabilis]HEH4209601.1 acyltransferase [Proteus mirabilis]
MQKIHSSSLDLLKYLLSILIVIIHFRPDNYGILFGYIPSELARCAVPAFFIISGYFMSFDNEKINQWLLKISKLYVVWSFSYFIYFYFVKESPIDAYFILSSIVSGWGHLWYFPALIFAYVIASALKQKRSSVLISISLILLISGIYIQYTKNQIISVNGYRNFLFIGLPFILIGILIKRFYVKITNVKCFLYLIIILLSTSFFEYYYNVKNGIEYELPLLSIPLSIVIVIFFSKIKFKSNFITVFLGNSSVAIYLIHPLLIDIVKTYNISNIYILNLTLILVVSSIIYFISKKIWIDKLFFGK